jgi:hypothetical protein
MPLYEVISDTAPNGEAPLTEVTETAVFLRAKGTESAVGDYIGCVRDGQPDGPPGKVRSGGMRVTTGSAGPGVS